MDEQASQAPTNTPQIQTPQQPTPPQAKNSSSKKQTILLLVGALLLVVLIIGGIVFGFSYLKPNAPENQLSTSIPQTTSTSAQSDEVSPIPTPKGPKTYKSNDYGWSIVYPEGIYLTQVQLNPENENLLGSVDFSSQSPPSTAQQNSLTLSVQMLEKPSGQSLEEAANSISSEENSAFGLGGTTVSPKIVNSLQGYMVVFEGNSEVPGWTDVYLPAKDPQNLTRIRYSLRGEDFRDEVEKMLQSFKN